MKCILSAAVAFAFVAVPAFAEGDAEEGAKNFNKCKACHVIVDDAGEEIVKGGKTGPNLYGVVGRTAGTYEGFNYSDAMVSAGEAGLVWEEADFATYVADPSKFLKEYLDDTSARGKMTFKLRKEDEVANIWAYLASVGPQS
ncbi:c-type cytochrome [Ruegeria profundi]|uniref:Cytochrome C n=1 Tax=Ruegeria profundi TaxID=1685378 RepID=A0A0X3TYJ8_9RHOB|nr:c-type cytochrome [Ruegeria profundi]KUJ80161.1 cytochrome C [Ruegeria profundi]